VPFTCGKAAELGFLLPRQIGNIPNMQRWSAADTTRIERNSWPETARWQAARPAAA
jgi:hypothetical protein